MNISVVFKGLALFLATVGTFVAAQEVRAGDVFQAGVAVVNITPYRGYRMSGYFSERFSTGTLDPLLAKAIVFKQGDAGAAIVFCDIIGVPLRVSRQVREIAARETGIPATNIAIIATHSHTGPLYFGALRVHFHNKALDKHGRDRHEIAEYSFELIGRVVRAIQKAQRSLKPVRLSAGYARENRLSFNRRFHMKGGGVRFNPGALNANIIRPAGPIDAEVGILKLTDAVTNKPTAAIISFALHLDTVGGTRYSADFPGFVQKHLQKTYGPGFVSLFGAGTCGDINHVDVTTRTRRKADEIGTMLARTVEQKLPQLAPVESLSLAVRTAWVNVPLQRYDEKQVADAKRNMDRVDSRQLPFLKRVEAYKIMALQLRGGTTIPLEVQAFRLSSDVAVVTLPGEVFVELGMAIKYASPFKTTLVIELANDAPGYIPTRKAFAEGSYETVNSRIKPGGGEEMVKVAVGLLHSLSSKK